MDTQHSPAPASSPSWPRSQPALDPARWSALASHARAVAASVLRRPTSHPDVEDRAQEALVSLLASGLPRFDASLGTLESLLGVITRNRVRSHLRDARTRARLDLRFHAESGASRGDEAPARRFEARRDLDQVLSRLCAGHAEALRRIDLAGEPIEEAARRLGKSYQAMNGQVGHARAAARRVARELLAA